MSEYVRMPQTDYVNACDALREKLGGAASIVSGQLAALIRSITGGTEPSGTLTITENGTFDVTEFAAALVSVAGGDHTVITRSGATFAECALKAEDITAIERAKDYWGQTGSAFTCGVIDLGMEDGVPAYKAVGLFAKISDSLITFSGYVYTTLPQTSVDMSVYAVFSTEEAELVWAHVSGEDKTAELAAKPANVIIFVPAEGGGSGGGIMPEGTISIEGNGTYDVSAFANAHVSVATPTAINGEVPAEYQGYVTQARAKVLKEYPNAQFTGLTLVLDGPMLWILLHVEGFVIGRLGRGGSGNMLSSAKGFYETMVNVKTGNFGTINGKQVMYYDPAGNVMLQIRTIVYSTVVWQSYGVLIYPQYHYDLIGGGKITYTFDTESGTLYFFARPAEEESGGSA